MPQEMTEGQIAGGEPQSKQTGVPDDGTPPEAGQESAYLGTFKTKEDAEKGLKDLQEILRRTQSDKDKATAENKKLQEQFLSKLTDSVTQLSQSRQTKSEPQLDIDSLVKRIDDEGGKAIVDVLGAYLQDYETKLTTVQKQEIERVRKEYQDELRVLKQAVQSVDPKYLTHRETVEKLEQDVGLSRDQAIKIAEMIDKTEQPPRPALPGSTGSDRVPDRTPEAKLSEQTKALLESSSLIGKITPEEEKALAVRREKK